MKLLLLLTLFVLLGSTFFSCKKDERTSINTLIDTTLNPLKESDRRPAFHFTPAINWMNDPNGMVFYKGQYHLFYQYNPNGNTWGPMNWGHTVSTDLFNWQDLPIALSPDNLGTVFSGSAVVDMNNTSGFKTGTESPMVAIYTSAGSQQSQSIAYSNDMGRNWAKYNANPVLPNPGTNDFRDPNVSWYDAAQKWVMVLAVGNKVQIYSSKDLKSWVLESEFGANLGSHGGVWECPNLFPIQIDGSSTTKWVLLVSINPGGPNGGSATQYFIGNFDGKTYTAENTDVLWADYGTDNYAGVTYNNIPSTDGRRIFIGWMSNWVYAGQVPTTTWRSTMTVPRTISLMNTANGLRLAFNPVAELENHLNANLDTTILGTSHNIQLIDNKIIKSGSYELNFAVDFKTTTTLNIALGDAYEKLIINIDKSLQNIFIDRGASGVTDFNSQFKQKMVCSFIPPTDKPTNIKILVDKTSIELFLNDGLTVMTALFFPQYNYSYLKIQTDVVAPTISGFRLTEINKTLVR